MATMRYSGDARVRITLIMPRAGDDNRPWYRCFVRAGTATHAVVVGLSADESRRIAWDSPEAFDGAAHAAFSFASGPCAEDPTAPDKGTAETIGNALAWDSELSGFAVTRKATVRK